MKKDFTPQLRSPTEIFIPKMTQACPDCGCNCTRCFLASNQLDIQHQVAAYEARISELTDRNMKLETELQEAKAKAQTDFGKMHEEHLRLRDRYERLYDSHKKMNQLNQNFEEKLLGVVEQYEAEKRLLAERIREADERSTSNEQRFLKIQAENTRLRADCRLAVSLLRNNPHLFIGQRLSALSGGMQQRVLRNTANAGAMDTSASTNDSDRAARHGVRLETIEERNANGYLHSENLIFTYPPTVAISMFHSDLDNVASQKRSSARAARSGDAHDYSTQFGRQSPAESVSSTLPGDDPLVPASFIADAIVHDTDAFHSEAESDIDQFVAGGFASASGAFRQMSHAAHRTSPDLIPLELQAGRIRGKNGAAEVQMHSGMIDLDLNSSSESNHGSPSTDSPLRLDKSGSVRVI